MYLLQVELELVVVVFAEEEGPRVHVGGRPLFLKVMSTTHWLARTHALTCARARDDNGRRGGDLQQK